MPSIASRAAAPHAPPRQWLCFPDAPLNFGAARLASYRVLVEDALGYLAFLEVRSRTPPTVEFTLAHLASTGWKCRTPWRPHRSRPGAPTLHPESDLEDPASWLIDAAVRDALGAALASGPPTPALDPARLRDELHERLSASLVAGLGPLVRALDPDLVAAARAAGGLTVARYNYLAGGDPVLRRNRLQAVSRHPILHDRLAIDAAYEPVRQAIDAGRSLPECLAVHFGVTKSVIRLVADTPIDWIDARWRARPHDLMALLSDIEPSKRPATREQWTNFDRAVALVANVSRQPATTTGNRLWLARSAREGFAHATSPGEDLGATAAALDAFAVVGVQETIREDLRDVVDPERAERLARHALAQVHQSLGVARMASLAAKWLAAWRVEQAAAEEELKLATGERWPSLLPDGLETDGLRVVALCTAAELREEAREMNHCVDTYAGACARGECQIFSVRSAHGATRSTIETNVERKLDGSFSVAVVQHKGFSNAKPPPACSRAAAALVKSLLARRADLEAYWRWRVKMVRLSRTDRATVARTIASRRALERVLPRRVAYEVLLQAALKLASREDGPTA